MSRHAFHGDYGNGKPGQAVGTRAPLSRRRRLHDSHFHQNQSRMLSVCRTPRTNAHTARPAAEAPETADSSNGPLQLHRRTAAAAPAAAALLLLLLQGYSGTCLHHSVRMRCKPKEVQGSTFPPCTPPTQTDRGQGGPQVAPCPTPRQQGKVPPTEQSKGGPVCRETQSVRVYVWLWQLQQAQALL